MRATLVGTPDPSPQLRQQRARMAAAMRSLVQSAPHRLRRVRARLS